MSQRVTMSRDRRTFLKRIGAAGTIALAGCTSGTGNGGDGGDGSDGGDGGDGGDGDGTDAGTPTATTVDSDVTVGMVYATGGLGDKSFNDQAQTGAERAQELMGVEFDEAQPEENTDFPSAQEQFAQSGNYDLINCIGFAQTDALTQNADKYPEQHWSIVDSTVDSDNVASYRFREHEGSFLAGALAGALTGQSFSAGGGSTSSDSTNVGFVGGLEVDLIKKFEAGYTAGVKRVNEDVDVITNYVGDFNDPQGGLEAASSMYDSGADIVYHAAGATGSGVFQAAQEAERYAIGVDRDQSVTAAEFSDVILASMVKRVDNAVYSAIESEVKGEFAGGTTTTLGLQENGVELVYGQDLGAEISTSIKEEIAGYREDIIAGEIDVPTSP
jgi:basic membrane protein A